MSNKFKIIRQPYVTNVCPCGTDSGLWDLSDQSDSYQNAIRYIYKCPNCGRKLVEVFLLDRLEIYEAGDENE